MEGFRPGVAERLGIGPDVCLERNPRLVYARITGWGQDGPYTRVPGHDINYLALAGALDPLRRGDGPPAPPLDLLGDYGGGGMLLVVGILSALFERSRSGRGQVTDAAMVDGVALLTTLLHGMRAEGLWSDTPGSNVLDLGAPFYNVYETADGRYLTIGSLLEGTDTCFAPVLTLAEAPSHPHNAERGTFQEVDGVTQPSGAPRFSRTPAAPSTPPADAGRHTADVLLEWDFSRAEVDAPLDTRAVRQAPLPDHPARTDAGTDTLK